MSAARACLSKTNRRCFLFSSWYLFASSSFKKEELFTAKIEVDWNNNFSKKNLYKPHKHKNKR